MITTKPEGMTIAELQKIQKQTGVNLTAYEYGKIFNNPDWESQSCNTVIAGTINTGKTHQALKFAEEVATYTLPNGARIQNRNIIIVNHTKNRSYQNIPIIGVEFLMYQLPVQDFPLVQVCPTDKEMEMVCIFITQYVRNAVIVFDDCASVFYGNLSDVLKDVVKTPKNNANDMIYQFHSFAEVTPMLLLNSSMTIVKQTLEPKLAAKVPNTEFIRILGQEVRAENKTRPNGQKWATRIFNIMDSKVGRMIGNSEWEFFEADDYFEGKF
jgi:hypothetical protein